MSGYNADIAQPEEREPIVLVNKPEPYKEWEVNSLLGDARYSSDEYLDENQLAVEVDVPKLVQTVRTLFRNSHKNIEADDPRLEHIWEEAGNIADRRGYCDVFETVMEELGTGYTRTVEGYAQVEVTLKMTVSVPVEVSRAEADDWSSIEVDDYMVNDSVGYATIDSDNIEDYKVVGFEPC